MTDRTEERAQAAFRVAQARWREALDAHRLAPPDAGFRARLAELSVAAHAESEACRDELRQGSGRRGPEELWRRFDAAAADLSRAATGSDILAVADAYAELSEAAGALAEAVEREDRVSGPLRSRRPGRAA